MKRPSKVQETYIARVNLLHSHTGAITRPGEEADLSHLSPDEIEMLVEKGAVERVVRAEPDAPAQEETL
jgi:hypothetical protein